MIALVIFVPMANMPEADARSKSILFFSIIFFSIIAAIFLKKWGNRPIQKMYTYRYKYKEMELIKKDGTLPINLKVKIQRILGTIVRFFISLVILGGLWFAFISPLDTLSTGKDPDNYKIITRDSSTGEILSSKKANIFDVDPISTILVIILFLLTIGTIGFFIYKIIMILGLWTKDKLANIKIAAEIPVFYDKHFQKSNVILTNYFSNPKIEKTRIYK